MHALDLTCIYSLKISKLVSLKEQQNKKNY
jgi:hypothetical protein